MNYIHLNPARARLVAPPSRPLSEYRWSSFPGYRFCRRKRPEWQRVERVLGSHYGMGLKAYADYLEGRAREELDDPSQRVDGVESQIRRGWFVGGEAFRSRLEDRLAEVIKGHGRDSHPAAERRTHDEVAAQQVVGKALAE